MAVKLVLLALAVAVAVSTVHAEDARELGYSYTDGPLLVGPAEIEDAAAREQETRDLAAAESMGFEDIAVNGAFPWDHHLVKKDDPNRIHYFRDGMANTGCTRCQLEHFKACYRKRAYVAERKARSPGVCEGDVAKDCQDKCWKKRIVLVSERHAAWKGTNWCVQCVEKQNDHCAELDPAAHKKNQCYPFARAKCGEAGYCKEGELRNSGETLLQEYTTYSDEEEEEEIFDLDEAACKAAGGKPVKQRGYVSNDPEGKGSGKAKKKSGGCAMSTKPKPKCHPAKCPKAPKKKDTTKKDLKKAKNLLKKMPKVKVPKIKIPKVKPMKKVHVRKVTAQLAAPKKAPKKRKYKKIAKKIKKAKKKAAVRVKKPKKIKKPKKKKPSHIAYWKRVIARARRRAAYYRRFFRARRRYYYRRMGLARRRIRCVRRAIRHRPWTIIHKPCNKPSCKPRGPRLHVGGGRRRHRRNGWLHDIIRGEQRPKRKARRFHPRGRKYTKTGKKKPSKLGPQKLKPGSIQFAKLLSRKLIK